MNKYSYFILVKGTRSALVKAESKIKAAYTPKDVIAFSNDGISIWYKWPWHGMQSQLSELFNSIEGTMVVNPISDADAAKILFESGAF